MREAMRFAAVLAAELAKLRTLPAAALTAAGCVLVAAAIAAAVSAPAADRGAPTVVQAVCVAVPFVQAGFVLLGILSVSQEHAGRQLGTTLTAVPDRRLLLTGKTTATLLVLAVTAVAAVGASALAAAVAAALSDAPTVLGEQPGRLAGAAAYLTAIGMLSHAVALLVRHLVPALVIALGVVMIVSPVLAAVSEHARWLPDRAAAQLYDPGDAVLTAGTGALVAACWIGGLWLVGALRFTRLDA
jgi:hypothetical protein